MSPSPFAIETEGLTKVYRRWFGRTQVPAVANLTLQVPTGRTYGFLGPNGAGKTTTIKMLLGLVRPSAGSGQLLGRPLGDQEARRCVGFLPEEPSFASHLKARDFLTYCARLSRLPSEGRPQRIDQILELVGLSQEGSKRLSDFSRGMLERIGIAQAILHDPELLILDEPMTGLDPPGRREIKKIMQDLGRQGKTLFFSSHILTDVQELCDWVGILNRGRLVVSGPIADLLEAEGVQVTVPDLPATVIEKVAPLVNAVERNGTHWNLRMSDAGQRDRVLELLQEHGCRDVSVTELRQDLESLFMKTIEGDAL